MQAVSPSRVPVSIKVGYEVLNADGLHKVLGCVKIALEFLGACFHHAPEWVSLLGSSVKVIGEGIMPFQFFKIGKEWADVQNKNWGGRGALVCITTIFAIKAGHFLDKVKMFPLSSFVSKVGSIPVLGTIVKVPFGVFVIGASSFSIADTVLKQKKARRENKTPEYCAEKLGTWKTRQTFLSPSATTVSEDQNDQDNSKLAGSLEQVFSTNPFNKNIKNVKLALFSDSVRSVTDLYNRANSTNHPGSSDAADYSYRGTENAYVDFKCSKWETKLSNASTERKKSRLSIANNVSKIAFTLLGLAGASLGIAALATNTLPMLFLGLVVASFAVGVKVFETRHKEPHKVPERQGLEAAIYNDYVAKKMAYPGLSKKVRPVEVRV